MPAAAPDYIEGFSTASLATARNKMAKSNRVFRFCVGRDGEARSAVYRFWTPAQASGRSDVYLAMRGMGEEFKVSVHADRCHIAVSDDAAKTIPIGDRFLNTWNIGLMVGAEKPASAMGCFQLASGGFLAPPFSARTRN